jgi:O-antigen/teichoic acid export membrane protein
MTPDSTRTPRPTVGLWRRLRGPTLVGIGVAAMNVAGYVFTLVAVHVLAPADFGAMTALLGLVLIGNVASLGLQATGARRIASHPDRSEHDLLAASLLRAGRYTAVGLGLLTLLLTPLIVSVLHIDSVVAVLLISPTLVLLTVMGAQAGALQGRKHWRELAWLYTAFGAGRLGFGVLGLLVSPDLIGVMAGIVAGVAVPVALGVWMLRGRGRGSRTEVRRVLSETVHGTHVLLAFFAMANADVLLARIVLDPHDSGIYAAGVIIAKACLFLPQFVMIVVFPSLASAPGDTRRLRRAVLAVGGLGVCAILGTLLLPDLVVTVLGGADYAEIGPIAWLFAAAGSTYAVLQLVVYAAIAQQERRAALLIWCGLAVLTAVALLVIGRGTVTGLDGVKLLAATAGGISAVLAIVLATGLHRSTTFAQP